MRSREARHCVVCRKQALRDRSEYGERLRVGAKKLGVSVRSVQRLFKKYQEQGITALLSTSRTDKGNHRISEFWQDFILKTYKQGNKGSKRMSPKQVALRVQAKAAEIGDDKTLLKILIRATEGYIGIARSSYSLSF